MTPVVWIDGVNHPVNRLDVSLASSTFIRNAIQFCRDWLDGRSTFTFHTSGSTGTPKSIIFTRQQLVSSAQLSAKALHIQPGETSLVCLDTNLIAGAMMLVRSLEVGMDIILQEPSANPISSIQQPVHFVALVPYQVETLLRDHAHQLESIQTVIIGGAPLQQSTAKSLKSFTNSIYATYGMTETITHIALQQLSGSSVQEHFHVLDTILLATDERGCLTIRAPHLGKEPIVTNDLVQLITPQSFEWLGRIDRVINSGGIKIQAEHIEQVVEAILKEESIIGRFFISGISDHQLGERVTLFFEGTLSQQQKAFLHTTLTARLKRYEVPKEIICMHQFAETASQKIDRFATVRNLE